MKCPYNDNECRYVDTSDMTVSKACEECECYDKGIRATGGCAKTAVVILLVIVLLSIGCTRTLCPAYKSPYNNESIVHREPKK